MLKVISKIHDLKLLKIHKNNNKCVLYLQDIFIYTIITVKI